MTMSCRLSVNVNKIALLRNSRGTGFPNVVRVAKDCVMFGADGITVHPRPDERHIKRVDVYQLAEAIQDVELNIEGYPSESFLSLIKDVRPGQCTFVPDPPNALTSSEGWDTIKHREFLTDVLAQIRSLEVRSSLFIETDLKMIEGAKVVGTDRVELYTEPYARQYGAGRDAAIAPYVPAAARATELGLGLNAGHDLNLANAGFLIERIPNLLELSIGHALFIEAIYLGLAETIRRYKNILAEVITTPNPPETGAE